MEILEKNRYVQTFDSILDLAEYVEANKDKIPKYGYAKSMDAAMDWRAAIDCGLQGGYWPEGANKIEVADIDLADLNIHAETLPRIENSVVGHRPDVAAFLANSPMSMIRMKPSEQPNRLIRVCVNVATSYDVQSHTALNRGNAILSICNALDAAGYTTEIWAVQRAISKSRSECSFDVCIKDATAHYSPDSIAFALANSSMQRRLTFSAMHIAIDKYQDDDTNCFDDAEGEGWGHGNDVTYPDYDLSFGFISSGDRWTKENSLHKAIDITRKQLTALDAAA